jgi:tripartite-type tricarboxylate transporter receptor subunit TctC
MKRPNRIACALSIVLASAAPLPGFAQEEYPARPIRLVVPFPPGGAIDLTARLFQPRLSAALGQPLIVDNRPGAAGAIGAESVSRATPDGYTLLYTVGADLAIRNGKPGALDLARDLTPIAAAVASVSCVAARADLPINSMAELIDYAKRNPGKLTYGSSGIGSTQHLTGERLRQYGIDIVHVPFKGVAPALTALVAGQIDLVVTNLATAMPQLRQGKVKLLAVTQPIRFEGARDIPAVNEALPGFDMPIAWYGFFGPPKLPAAIVTRLNAEIVKTLQAPELKGRIADASMSAMLTTPGQFVALIRDTTEAYGKVVKAAGVQLE